MTARNQGLGLLFIQNVALFYESDDCLTWPYLKTNKGYPVFKLNRSTALAHRIICDAAHGPPPPGRPQAAHSCGVRACVNYRHLRWASQSENDADKLAHGTLGTKLDASAVAAIRRLGEAGVLQKDIAAKFGVQQAHVSRILRRVSWRGLPEDYGIVVSLAEAA